MSKESWRDVTECQLCGAHPEVPGANPPKGLALAPHWIVRHLAKGYLVHESVCGQHYYVLICDRCISGTCDLRKYYEGGKRVEERDEP